MKKIMLSLSLILVLAACSSGDKTKTAKCTYEEDVITVDTTYKLNEDEIIAMKANATFETPLEELKSLGMSVEDYEKFISDSIDIEKFDAIKGVEMDIDTNDDNGVITLKIDVDYKEAKIDDIAKLADSLVGLQGFEKSWKETKKTAIDNGAKCTDPK